MSSCGKRHKELTNGVGRCSVPMFSMYGPAGFCDKPAYGRPPESRLLRDRVGNVTGRADGRYNGYVPALACPVHGGPTLAEVLKDRTVIRFGGPPGPESGHFIEVERNGRSISLGKWFKDGNDWLLVLPECEIPEVKSDG